MSRTRLDDRCLSSVMDRRAVLFAIPAALAGLSACSKKKRKVSLPAATRPVVIPPKIGDTERGIASWYGHPYHGRRAANGEIYDMEKLTAAHRTLPFETWVEVENLANGKKTTVRITDRGPFIEGRVIDLSHAAAREIEMIGPGISQVKITVIAPPRIEQPADLFGVQVGAFSDPARAESVRAEYQSQFGTARLVRRAGNPVLWRVLVGSVPTEDAAEELAVRIRAVAAHAFVVRLDPPAAPSQAPGEISVPVPAPSQ